MYVVGSGVQNQPSQTTTPIPAVPQIPLQQVTGQQIQGAQIQSPTVKADLEAANPTSQQLPQGLQNAPLPANAAAPQPAPAPKPSAPPVSSTPSTSLPQIPLAAASAFLSGGPNLVSNVIMGSNNQVQQITLIDPQTHEVVAQSPPDSIARMQLEMELYQSVAKQRAQQ